ncbi:hypothetical protein IC582_004998 [Cucumis melo]
MNKRHLLYSVYDSIKAMRSEGFHSILFSSKFCCSLVCVLLFSLEFRAVFRCTSYENAA